MPQSGYLLKFQSWTYAPIKTGEQFFSERPLPKELFPGKRPRLQGTKRWLPEKPALLQTNLDREVQRTEKNLTLMHIQGTQLPLVMSVLLSKKYLQNLMQTQVIQNLSQVGITNMAQRVATKNTLIAGRLHLFTQNWRAITQDPWVINSIQGYTIDLVSQPVQYQTPKELSFPQEETRSLTEEVVKMVEKGAISVVPREQKAKGFHSQLFCVPKKDGGKETYNQPKRVELICGDSALQNGGHPHAKRHPLTRRLDDKGRPEGCILHDQWRRKQIIIGQADRRQNVGGGGGGGGGGYK